jgi:hypothetical protein
LTLLVLTCRSHNCFPSDVHQNWTLFAGVLNGNIRGHQLNSSPCTSLDFRHEEFGCLDEKILAFLPPRHIREKSRVPFSLFTILRHPIDRIGAQAFYGKTVGVTFIKQNILKHCLSNHTLWSFHIENLLQQCHNEAPLPQSTLCQCFYQTLQESFHTLRMNESLWFNWFASPSYRDGYMSNYYIKRLIGGVRLTSQNHLTTPTNLRDCLLNPKKDCTGHDLLQELFPSVRCTLYPFTNMTLARIKAEHLLKTQYDFSILERFSDPSTPFFFQSLFREREIDRIRSSLSSLNSSRSANWGFIKRLPSGYAPARSSTSPLKYASFFPESVLKFLLDDNAEDITLYHSAVKIYHHRINRLMAI